MDVEKTGCYRLYRCRSLLACDSGGTVYETSQRLEDSDGEALYKNADNSPSQSSQSENIIYIIDQDNEVRASSNSPLSQQTLTDLNTCLENHKFGDYKPCLNVNYEFGCSAIVQYTKEENASHDGSFKYYIVQCDDIDSTQNSSTETLDSDSFDRENFEYYCESINSSASAEDNSNNSSNNDTVSDNLFSYNQDVAQFCYLQKTDKCSDYQNVTETINYSPSNPDVELATRHTRKRKQCYEIKRDSFDDDSSDALSVNEIGKKKKSSCSRYDPFENLKMSSILKKEHCAKSQIQLNHEDSDRSNVFSKDKVFNCRENACQTRRLSSFPYHDQFARFIDTSVRLNWDLTRADYLEYVQPREKIIESDMDKLLSPTIAPEMYMIAKNREITQHVQQTQGQIDCNGNDVYLRETCKHNANLKVSASEAVEKQLMSKAVYARKLGFQNIFNTSNGCVIDEILFDHSFSYRDIQLEIDLVSVRKNSQSKIPLKLLQNFDERFTNCHHSNDSFTNVSCSLPDTSNGLNSFGEFAEFDRADKANPTEVIHYVVSNDHQGVHRHAVSNTIQKQRNCTNLESNSSVNFSMAKNALSFDINANYDSAKYVSSSSINDKQQIAPLKMRIKRVSNDNQYVIDDSGTFNVQVDNELTLKSQKSPDSKYECSSCSEKFRTKRLLKSHISENHKGPYDLECEICHMKSKKSSAFKKHKTWCDRSTAFKCEICQKVYCYKAVLLRHTNSHKD